MSTDGKIQVMELFGPTIQGEGLLLGHPTHFLRTGGCGYRCSWCDSMFAVDPELVKQNRRLLSLEDIAREIERLPKAPWLTLTGGDPAIQPLGDLIPWCWHNGMQVAIETQGEFWPEWMQQVDVATFSPKGPSSGMNTSIDNFTRELAKFRQVARSRICVKVVVFNMDDLTYATRLLHALQPRVSRPLYTMFTFQVGSPLNSEIPTDKEFNIDRDYTDQHPDRVVHIRATWKRDQILQRYQWLVETLLQHSELLDENVTITPQVHTLLWPLEERGR